MRAVLLVACALGVAAGIGCLDSPSSTNCQQYIECSTCTMVAECSFCLETNQCITDSQVCGGDRAQLPDMCEGE
jgi:hypothetical protein